MVKQKPLAWLALGASFLAFSVIALGAFTRLIDAGLTCPDWPGCYGQLMATTPKAWAEMVHRYLAGSLGIFIVSILCVILFNKQYRTHQNCFLMLGLITLLVYQILLGRWTVTLKLVPVIVTQHLIGGYLILTVLWLIYLANRNQKKLIYSIKNKKGILFLAFIALLLLFFQIVLGAWTSTHYASLSCPDFPFCSNEHPFIHFDFKQAFALSPIGINYEGGVLPLVIRQTIQMTHRLGAFVLITYFLFFSMIATHTLKQEPRLLKPVYLILLLLFIQLGLGMTNVLFKLPIGIAVCHTLVALLLWLSVITFIDHLISSTKETAS